MGLVAESELKVLREAKLRKEPESESKAGLGPKLTMGLLSKAGVSNTDQNQSFSVIYGTLKKPLYFIPSASHPRSTSPTATPEKRARKKKGNTEKVEGGTSARQNRTRPMICGRLPSWRCLLGPNSIYLHLVSSEDRRRATRSLDGRREKS
ncbi:hypothetical protein EVAR_80337_1 [Eumeta japonica]|uniref:Uncharacterized protein n=1 Tax=Eumeta variegata TaxID=151549 RepID=A0A4C1X2S3_EUMVA|nr:hypothetical protein EVAR_80337_1 [Eumeta japonica]